eukprot:g48036.t1
MREIGTTRLTRIKRHRRAKRTTRQLHPLAGEYGTCGHTVRYILIEVDEKGRKVLWSVNIDMDLLDLVYQVHLDLMAYLEFLEILVLLVHRDIPLILDFQ